MSERKFDIELRSKLASHQKRPPADLWKKVNPQSSRKPAWLYVAASVLVLLGVFGLVQQSFFGDRMNVEDQSIADIPELKTIAPYEADRGLAMTLDSIAEGNLTEDAQGVITQVFENQSAQMQTSTPANFTKVDTAFSFQEERKKIEIAPLELLALHDNSNGVVENFLSEGSAIYEIERLITEPVSIKWARAQEQEKKDASVPAQEVYMASRSEQVLKVINWLMEEKEEAKEKVFKPGRLIELKNELLARDRRIEID
ncbi:MAG: hypothetical protein LAT68_02340 [Cyclobacteriaceae bacterium]|nr:hypothetical protein [Cyclobacteriaceae bacterium]MCH8515143.1 hypothetical protein [Cyclobacteriaceae bacterium]